MNFDIPFNFNDYSSILLIFFVIGMVFSILTLWIGVVRESTASKWLSLLLLLCTLYICPHMLGYAGWYSRELTRETLFFLPFMQVFLIGPVVYFYTQSQLNPNFRLTKRDYWHFLPAVLYGLYTLVVFVTDQLILDEFYFYADNRDKDMATWYQATGLVSMVCYLGLSLRFYRVYKEKVLNAVSYADTILFPWIRNFMLAFLSLLLLRVLFFILNPDWGQFGSQFWYYLCFSFVFAYVAIAGYSNIIKSEAIAEVGLKVYNVFGEEEDVLIQAEIVAPIAPPIRQAQEKPPASSIEPRAKKAVETNQMEDAEIAQTKADLQEVMRRERLYERPRLTLTDIAELLGTTTKVVSTVVNRGFAMNFNDYVNQFRIEAVKDKLKSGEHATKTLLGVALECGFNSKATFNRAFKKHTGSSPREYLEHLTVQQVSNPDLQRLA